MSTVYEILILILSISIRNVAQDACMKVHVACNAPFFMIWKPKTPEFMKYDYDGNERMPSTSNISGF